MTLEIFKLAENSLDNMIRVCIQTQIDNFFFSKRIKKLKKFLEELLLHKSLD